MISLATETVLPVADITKRFLRGMTAATQCALHARRYRTATTTENCYRAMYRQHRISLDRNNQVAVLATNILRSSIGKLLLAVKTIFPVAAITKRLVA